MSVLLIIFQIGFISMIANIAYGFVVLALYNSGLIGPQNPPFLWLAASIIFMFIGGIPHLVNMLLSWPP